MLQKKTITICSSATHYKNAIETQQELQKLGYRVIVPKTANIMKRTNNYDVSFYKTWAKNKKEYSKKTKLIIEHFKKIIKADAILVTNFEKNGMSGYIGGNVLMEMAIAFHYRKPIFVYNNISEKLGVKEEVYGLRPIFIEKDVKRIKPLL